MTVKEIVIKYLKENGYDGLGYPRTNCHCGLKDIMPCMFPLDDCQAGYLLKSDGVPFGWMMSLEKPEKGKVK